MGLADIASIPRTPEELKRWAFCHYVHHVDINRVIERKYQTVIPTFDISHIDPSNDGVWVYQHQLMHTNMDQILGISGNDLLGLDFNNPAILKAWLFLHLPEHQQASASLGV